MNLRYDDGCTHQTSDFVAGAKDENSNAVKLTGVATGVAAKVQAVGDDTNVSLNLVPQATAQVISTTRVIPTFTVSTVTTASAVTYTAAQLLGGLILRDPNGAGRSDILPTGALVAAAIPGVAAGHSFEFTIRNDADAAETITLTAGTGASVTGGGTMTIAQNNMKTFRVVFTSASAYTCYSLGSVVF
jgi:hypothetical protein